jgi:hypothetical protein
MTIRHEHVEQIPSYYLKSYEQASKDLGSVIIRLARIRDNDMFFAYSRTISDNGELLNSTGGWLIRLEPDHIPVNVIASDFNDLQLFYNKTNELRQNRYL